MLMERRRSRCSCALFTYMYGNSAATLALEARRRREPISALPEPLCHHGAGPLTPLQELRAPILALRAFNVETALIADHAKSEMLMLMRCQVGLLQACTLGSAQS